MHAKEPNFFQAKAIKQTRKCFAKPPQLACPRASSKA